MAYLKIGDARAHELQHDDNTGRLIPILPRLAFLYPVFCAMFCYALWYTRNFSSPVFHPSPA